MIAESEAGTEEDVLRVLVFAAAEAFSVLSAVDAVDDPAFAFGGVDLAAEAGLEALPPSVFEVLDLAVDGLAVETEVLVSGVLAVEVFAFVVLEVDDFELGVLEAFDFVPAGLDAFVLADEDLVVADFVPVDFDGAAFVPIDFDCVVAEDPALAVPDLAAVDFEEDVFEADAFVSVPVSVAVLVERVVPVAFGLRRREDCIEAAGSVRAVRDVFVSPSRLPSSVLPPEKKTSTGRSLEFASGISAPRPRPKPLFLRSTTTYSSIRNFFSSFPIRQGAAGMWVI